MRGLQCPECFGQDTKVINSRALQHVNGVKRRRECKFCGHRWSTVELSNADLENIDDTIKMLGEYAQGVQKQVNAMSRIIGRCKPHKGDE